MIRKMLVVAAAVAMPVSVIAVTGGVAGAKAPTGIVADTIQCTTTAATVNLNPALTPSGQTSGPAATTTITSALGSVSGCTVTTGISGTPLTNVTGNITGTITAKKAPSVKHPGSTCGGLLGASKEAKGSTLSIHWVSSTPGAPVIPDSTIALKSVTGGVGGDGHGTFNVAGKASGSFLGQDKGKSSSLAAETVQTVADLGAECTPSPGISTVPIQNNASGITLS